MEKSNVVDIESDSSWKLEVSSTEMEKSIALKWLKAKENFECSWDGKEYRSVPVSSAFLLSLTEEERTAPIVRFIVTFDSWGNDMCDITQDILGYKYGWEKLKEKFPEMEFN